MATGTTAIRSPTDDITNHTIVLRQLKEVAEVGQRLRGDPTESFIKINELVNAGVIRFVNNVVQGVSASASAVVSVADSIQGAGTAGSPLQLVGDSATPGNSMAYSTNSSGVKGWYAVSSGGSSTLAGLSDVLISSPTNSQVLTYNSSAAKWENQNSSGAVTAVPATISDLQYWWSSDNVPSGASARGIWALANKNPAYGGNIAQVNGSFSTAQGPVPDGSTLNGLPAVKWSGATAARMPLTLQMEPDQVTIFVVFKPNSSSGAVLLGAPQHGFEVDLGGGTGNFAITKSFDALLASSTATFTSGTWYQANVTWITSTGAYAFRQSRTATNSGSVGAQSWGANTTGFGWNVQGSNSDLNCYLAEFIFYSRVLTGTEITNVENYLFSKWGV